MCTSVDPAVISNSSLETDCNGCCCYAGKGTKIREIETVLTDGQEL